MCSRRVNVSDAPLRLVRLTSGERCAVLGDYSLELSRPGLPVYFHYEEGSDGWAPIEWEAVPAPVRARFLAFLEPSAGRMH